MEKAGCLGILMQRTKVGQNTIPAHCRSGIMASVVFSIRENQKYM